MNVKGLHVASESFDDMSKTRKRHFLTERGYKDVQNGQSTVFQFSSLLKVFHSTCIPRHPSSILSPVLNICVTILSPAPTLTL